MEEIEQLTKELDEIDEKFGDISQDRSDSLWTMSVAKKDQLAARIDTLIRILPGEFPVSSYLLSASNGRQTAAVQWIRFKKDPTHLNLLCYMLLNSSSNFLKYYVLTALADIADQCDYHQLIQLEKTLLLFLPPEQTSRLGMKLNLLKTIQPKIDFSISDIIQNSCWWMDVESKFFNSLAGIYQYRLSALQIIRNRKLFECFEQYRTQLEDKNRLLFVYHGSSAESLRSIAKDGFFEVNVLDDSSRQIAALDKGYFGRGIYHGMAADYAIHYAEKYRKSNQILLSVVLPGRSYIVKKGGEKFGRTCELGFDSHISPELKEIVLFRSAQVLPMFILSVVRMPNSNIVEEQL